MVTPSKKIQTEFLQANAKANAGGMIAIRPVESVESSSPSLSPPVVSLPPAAAAANAPANLLKETECYKNTNPRFIYH